MWKSHGVSPRIPGTLVFCDGLFNLKTGHNRFHILPYHAEHLICYAKNVQAFLRKTNFQPKGASDFTYTNNSKFYIFLGIHFSLESLCISAISDVIGHKWPLNTLCIVIANNQNTHLVILSHVSKYRLRPWFVRPEAKEGELHLTNIRIKRPSEFHLC